MTLLDALRGFALAGVLLANLEAFSLYFFLSPDAAAALPTLAADRWLAASSGLLVSAKFITLFSIMFGIGFALLMQRIGQTGGRRWYLRRLAVLFLIGLLHSAFWWGDILRWYALAGLLLLPMARLRPRNLAILSVALVCLPHLPWWQGDGSLAHVLAYPGALASFSSEHAATMLRGNQVFDLWWWQSHWRVPASLPGLMSIGLMLGNSNVLRDPGLHARFWKRLLPCLPIGLALALLVALSDYGRLGRFGPASAPWRHALDPGIVLMVALGYAALFVLLFSRPGWHRWLRHLAPVGRMALSNYLAQTAAGIVLFYGVGLGIGPRYGMVAVACTFVVLFGAQVAFSRWWLDRFRFGPAEWLWRSLTYWRRQPMRRVAADAADSTLAAST